MLANQLDNSGGWGNGWLCWGRGWQRATLHAHFVAPVYQFIDYTISVRGEGKNTELFKYQEPNMFFFYFSYELLPLKL